MNFSCLITCCFSYSSLAASPQALIIIGLFFTPHPLSFYFKLQVWSYTCGEGIFKKLLVFCSYHGTTISKPQIFISQKNDYHTLLLCNLKCRVVWSLIYIANSFFQLFHPFTKGDGFFFMFYHEC
jgi:hypothetical protein